MRRLDHYWGKSKDSALTEIAALFESHPQLARFSRYCRLKEQGPRKPALNQIMLLVDELKAVPDLATQFELADALMRAERDQQAYMLIPHPLVDQFILPVCKQWSVESPDDVWSLIWICTEESLREAVKRSPDHPVASMRLISMLQSQIEFLTDHLPTGVPRAGVVSALVEQCEGLFGAWVNEQRAFMFWETRIDRVLADSLTRYEASGSEISFEEWARLLTLPACYDEAVELLERQGVTRPKFPD